MFASLVSFLVTCILGEIPASAGLIKKKKVRFTCKYLYETQYFSSI